MSLILKWHICNTNWIPFPILILLTNVNVNVGSFDLHFHSKLGCPFKNTWTWGISIQFLIDVFWNSIYHFNRREMWGNQDEWSRLSHTAQSLMMNADSLPNLEPREIVFSSNLPDPPNVWISILNIFINTSDFFWLRKISVDSNNHFGQH